jgi:hypothetical protein
VVTTTFGVGSGLRTAPSRRRRAAALASFLTGSAATSAYSSTSSPRGIDEPRPVAHLLQRSRVDRAARLVRQRQVQREEVSTSSTASNDALPPRFAALAETNGSQATTFICSERAPRDLPWMRPKPRTLSTLSAV